MAINHFTFDPLKTDAFLRFGTDLYHGDQRRIPPIKKDMCAQFLPDFNFYQKPGNRHRHFLATSGGKIVGRVSAIFNQDLMDKDGTSVGSVGFFECIDDFEVTRDLLDCAIEWLREEKKICRIWGPMNFDIWHGYRLMTKGFDQKPFYGEPYNKRYYPDYFVRYGFVPKYFWDSIEITKRGIFEKIISFGEQQQKFLADKGYHFRQPDVKQIRADLKGLHSMLTSAFKGFTGFTPIGIEEFRLLFEKIRLAFRPELFTVIYDENNVIAGFAMALLELSDALRSMKERDNLFARMKFIRSRKHVNRINFYLIGITPEEEKKKSGLGRAISSFMIRKILNMGFETIIFALMSKENRAHKLLGKHGQKSNREYALFELNL